MNRIACATLLMAWGCSSNSASTFDPGLDLNLRVAGAQLQQGPLATENGGPSVSQILRPQPVVVRGESGVSLGGRLSQGGVALHLHAEGDANHWVISAGGEDFVVPDQLVFSASFGVSHTFADDSLVLRLQAADADGRLGPMSETTFVISDERPPARMVVELAWDAAADVDLHLRLPDGTVVGPRNINSYDPSPGDASDAFQEGGILAFDSNPECVLDLRNIESIAWSRADPPSGQYSVFAHLFSPCGQSSVTMQSSAQFEGDVISRAAAIQIPFDSRVHPTEGEAPGLWIMDFEIP